MLRRFVAHLKKRMQATHVLQESPQAFLLRLLDEEQIEEKPLKFFSDRLRLLLRTLQVRRGRYSSRGRPRVAPHWL